MRFSQRIGKRPPAKLAQRESMDDDLRSSLWSLLSLFYWDTATGITGSPIDKGDRVRTSSLGDLVLRLWFHHFKRPIDTIEKYWGNCLAKIREYFFEAEWDEIYDFVEFVALNGPEEHSERFIEMCNTALADENSAYRFVNKRLAEITSAAEIESVETAAEAATPYPGVSQHLERALALMSDRRSPDYRNSIKESISAVESLAKHIAGDPSATLGAVLKELERTKNLHPALKSAFSALYGYTSDAQGIRHALLDEPSLTKADSRFMLVCCSAFINFTIEATSAK